MRQHDAQHRHIVKRYRERAAKAHQRCHHQVPGHTPANVRWCLDLTGKQDAHGVLHVILGVMDHGSRACLCLHRLQAATSQSILDALGRLMAAHGKLACIRTDHGAQFASAAFAQGVRALGIRHEFTAIASPWQNRIERMFGTLSSKGSICSSRPTAPRCDCAQAKTCARTAHWLPQERLPARKSQHRLSPRAGADVGAQRCTSAASFEAAHHEELLKK